MSKINNINCTLCAIIYLQLLTYSYGEVLRNIVKEFDQMLLRVEQQEEKFNEMLVKVDQREDKFDRMLVRVDQLEESLKILTAEKSNPVPKILGDWKNEGTCNAFRDVPTCRDDGIQVQSRTCVDGTVDKCKDEDTHRITTCKHAGTICVATDIMVATGEGSSSVGDSVETIRITEAGNKVTVGTCLNSAPTYPLKVNRAAGATLINGEPLICGGGFPLTERCYQLVNNQWQDAPQLPWKRYGLKMATTDQTTFISGGSDGSRLNDFHQLKGGSWHSLSSLPIKVRDHCLLALNSTHLLNIGGYSGSSYKSREVYMYDIGRDRWTEVASMKEKRSEHSCLTISTPSENKVLVCGGDGRTDCEIWTNGQWTNGPTVPSSTYGSRMVKPSLNSQYAAFVVGGYMGYMADIWDNTNKIYGIKKDLTSVSMLGTFQQKRRHHVALQTKCQ